MCSIVHEVSHAQTDMGSKILKGERSLTVEDLRKLADRFKVRPDLFMD